MFPTQVAKALVSNIGISVLQTNKRPFPPCNSGQAPKRQRIAHISTNNNITQERVAVKCEKVAKMNSQADKGKTLKESVLEKEERTVDGKDKSMFHTKGRSYH